MSETLPADYYAHTAPKVTDWASFISFSPGAYFTPASVDELAAILGQVLAEGRTGNLRVLGGLHSCSEICRSDIVIDTTRLPLEFDVQPLPGGGGAVTASAFMHAHEFLARAAQHNLSLTALGGTDAQTLAGLISTNTAGATVHTSVYETLQWVEYLTPGPDGRTIETRRVAAGDPDFPAVVCSLGAIGFLTRVCFNLVDELFFSAAFEIKPLQEILGDIPKTCATHDFWRVEWLPKMEIGLLWHADPIPPPADRNGDYPTDQTENILKLLMGVDDMLLKDGPYLNLALEAAYLLLSKTYTPILATGPMRNMIPCDRLAPLHVAMAEWSFDPADLPKVMDCCRAYFDANKWPNLPTEIECTRTDAYLMSAWNWPDLPYIVKLNFQYLTDFLTPEEKAEVTTHLQGLWSALEAAGIRFKGHWGKINFLTPEAVAKLYHPQAFLPHVKAMFLNDYLRKRLYAA
jgi:FAD binding domain